MLHRIRKQVMDLTINGRLDAFRTQHLAGPFYYRQLLPVLEKIFDELSSGEEAIQLDKLELDLGIIPVRELENIGLNSELEDLLRQQVVTALQEQRKELNLRRRPGKENSCRRWLFYLQHGYLPWNSRGFDEKTLNDILEMLATNYSLVQELRELIQRDKQARARIVRGYEVRFLVALVEVLTATAQRELAQAVDELVKWFQIIYSQSPSGNNHPKQLCQKIWLQVIQWASGPGPALKTTDLVKAVMLSEEDIQAISANLTTERTTLGIIYPVWKEIQQENRARQSSSADRTTAKKPGEKEKAAEKSAVEPDEINEHGIFVSHAGLILLHPFIPTLFKNLGLTSERDFHSDEAAEKALLLLHYLATGNTGAQEYELVIPKILCGLPIHQSLASVIELMPGEKQEADDMLAVVIENWERLGNASIEALRENFLQREGKLYTKNDIRCLQVETGSLDVLLDFLSWTLSIVKLPWMKEMLRVEWR